MEHKSIRKKYRTNTNQTLKNQYSLLIHYRKFPTKTEDVYKVQFFERPTTDNLDYTEQQWIKKN